MRWRKRRRAWRVFCEAPKCHWKATGIPDLTYAMQLGREHVAEVHDTDGRGIRVEFMGD